MPDSSRPSASVIAAAVVAILAGLFLLLGGAMAFFGFLLNASLNTSAALPPSARTLMLGMTAFMICLSIFGIATGVGLVFLKNWARISILIWGGLSAFFGVLGIPIILLIPLSAPTGAAELPPGSMQLIRVMLLMIYGLPFAVGIWWLILFNRKAVKVQFAGMAIPADSTVQKPRCPVPVTVLAWVYVASVLNLLFLPLVPVQVPVFLFGMLLPDRVGLPILILTCLAFSVCGVGILKLRPWSYSLAIGLQVFWLTSTVISMLRPNYKAAMEAYQRQIEASMHVPVTQFNPNIFTNHFGWFILLGLLFGAAILGMLIYYRPRFLAAAEAASSR